MIVVGTGPAGLTAAYLLAKRGHQVTLMDAADQPGGLWAGFEDKGRHFEKGMHNYVECGNQEIDHFFFNLPISRIPLEGNNRDVAGVYYNGKLYDHSPSVDLTDDPQHKAIVQELMWAAFKPSPRADRAMDRAAAHFGPIATERHIKPILRKLYGTVHLQGRALDLTNLHRLVLTHSETLAAELLGSPLLRSRIAWPNNATLPKEFGSGRRGFYPTEGMRCLVTAALGQLEAMGVKVLLGHTVNADCLDNTVWAAGLPALAKASGVNMPPIEARSITLVNLANPITAGPLHYFFCYQEHLKTFRVTCYPGFSLFEQSSVELLDVPKGLAADLAVAELREMGCITKHHKVEIAGVHELGPVLPLPTSGNDHLLDHLRSRLVRPGLHLVGAGARNGIFFQPDVLRHVWTTVHCQIGDAR